MRRFGWSGLLPSAMYCRISGNVDFFFQAEDGIRDHCVTGVQTCALPIWIMGTMIWMLWGRTLVSGRELCLSQHFGNSCLLLILKALWRGLTQGSRLGLMLCWKFKVKG